MEQATFTLRADIDADTFAGTAGPYDLGKLLKQGGGEITTDDELLIQTLRTIPAFKVTSSIATNLPDARLSGGSTSGAQASGDTTSVTITPVKKPAARRRRRTTDDKE